MRTVNVKDCPGALDDVRVLDMGGPPALYCTKLLADLGADVIKIEPPEGDPARRIGPFFRDEPHPEKSLYWFHFNTNKRSVTLNLEVADGREIFRRLARRADILIETFPPEHLDKVGLGYSVLREVNSRLIHVSITPFGQTGPWKNYKASDLIGVAAGGLMYVCGWPDRPPVRMGGSQAYHQASFHATAGTLIALYDRLTTGEGQHVDVAMHEAVPLSLIVTVFDYLARGIIRKREGNQFDIPAQGLFQCRDGYVDSRVLFYSGNWERVVQWMDSEGMAGDLKEEQWSNPEYRRQASAIQHINELFGAFVAKHTKQEIFEEGQRRGLVVARVNTAEDVAQDPHLAARRFFVPVAHPELGCTLQYLGAPYRLSETPWAIKRRAPLLGEHNTEIYEGELGLSKQDVLVLKQGGII